MADLSPREERFDAVASNQTEGIRPQDVQLENIHEGEDELNQRN